VAYAALLPSTSAANPGDRLLFQAGHGVLVEDLSDHRVPVPEDPADDLRRDPRLQAQRREGVPQVVEADDRLKLGTAQLPF